MPPVRRTRQVAAHAPISVGRRQRWPRHGRRACPVCHHGVMAEACWQGLGRSPGARGFCSLHGVPRSPAPSRSCTCTASRSPARPSRRQPGRWPLVRRTCPRPAGLRPERNWGYTLGIPRSRAPCSGSSTPSAREVILIGNSMGCPVSLEVAHTPRAGGPDRARVARRWHPQPGSRPGLGQLAPTGPGEPRMAAWRCRLPALRAGQHVPPVRRAHPVPLAGANPQTPVPTLAVIGSSDPSCHHHGGSGRSAAASDVTTVALIEGAAHAINFSHPGELVARDRVVARRPRSWYDRRSQASQSAGGPSRD